MSDNILGCFVSITHPNPKTSQEIIDLSIGKGKLFLSYIWDGGGICETLKKLKRENYGADIKLALFQFYVNPLPIEVQNLKAIESYRKSEKTIGIPIIVNDENFFSKSEEERYDFLKQSILQKMDLLAVVVKKKNLDTKMELLQADLLKIMNW